MNSFPSFRDRSSTLATRFFEVVLDKLLNVLMQMFALFFLEMMFKWKCN